MQLGIVVLVLQLSLSLFFVLSPEHGLLFKIFAFQVFSKLIDLSIQGVDHLILGFHDVFQLNFFSHGLVDIKRLFLKFELHFLHLVGVGRHSELASFNFRLLLPKFVFVLLDVTALLHELVILLDFKLVTLPS